jgi:proline iminopeptidase
MQDLLELYPVIDPYASGFLQVSDVHNIYWEQCGNPDGIPVLILHGGPGEGCSQFHRRFFDPQIFRIILFDQRGCGRSSPHGCLIDNTPDALVKDIEALRHHLEIDKWHLFGGSWGSTLALLYTLKHSEQVLSMILRGIFLLQKSEIDWFLYGLKHFAPEAWKNLTANIPIKKHKKILEWYVKALDSADKATQKAAASKWFCYESACATFHPNPNITLTPDMENQAIAMARIETHYFKKFCMDGRKSILSQLSKIKHIPLSIVQGQYDLICPPVSAQSVVDIWADAQYYLLNNAGHSMLDPEIKNKLLTLTYKLAEDYKTA